MVRRGGFRFKPFPVIEENMFVRPIEIGEIFIQIEKSQVR